MNNFGRFLNVIITIRSNYWSRKFQKRYSKVKATSHADQDVYIIWRNPSAGFFSNYFYVMGHVLYAIEHKMVPVVDFKSFSTPYTEFWKINGSYNEWEYYFEQPCKISLSEIDGSRNVSYSENKYLFGKVPTYWGGSDKELFPSRELVKELNETVMSYMKLNKATTEYLQKDVDIVRREQCLGVHIRGTDMIINSNHPDPFSYEKVIDLIINNSLQDKYHKILVCTDELEVVDIFQSIFGEDKIVVLDSFRIHQGSEKGVHTSNDYIRKNHRYKLGLEVLRDMLCLANCDSLICGHSNVPYAAIVNNNNKYEHLYVWETDRFIMHY